MTLDHCSGSKRLFQSDQQNKLDQTNILKKRKKNIYKRKRLYMLKMHLYQKAAFLISSIDWIITTSTTTLYYLFVFLFLNV